VRDDSGGMNTGVLVLPQTIAEDISAKASLSVETAGVLLVSVVLGGGVAPRLLARAMHWIPEKEYQRREYDHMSIRSAGYVPFLAEAERLGATPIWVHTHPGSDADPTPSIHDEEVDRQIADLFRIRSGSEYYGAAIFSPRPSGLAFTASLVAADGANTSISKLWEVGDRFRMTPAFNSGTEEIDPIFDRNVRAFGGGVQQALAQLCVSVVGCGGTGSAVAEQLVRLGVRKLILIDPDHLSRSNVTRVYGSTMSDVGRPKAEVLSDHLKRIAPDLDCATVIGMVTNQSVAKRLCFCDVIFGCTDDNAGRLVLSRISTFLLTPVFDSGVLLTSDSNNLLTGIDARVTTLTPGQACLVCRQRVDFARASAELMTPGERHRREEEGYAPALGRVEPAVVAYTTLVAATAISELLERLIGYGPQPRPSEVLLRCHEREISTNIELPRGTHYCNPASGKLGIGITEPFLEQMWTQ
jgi:proteasome lid subunit RPN8/RPN11